MEDASKEEHILCPFCKVRLYTGKQTENKTEVTLLNPSSHWTLMFKLTTKLALGNDFNKGSTEIIAGENSRHKPDAILYYDTDVKQQKPSIFKVETCISISDPNTVSQCALFSETAENTGGIFCLVVPENRNGESGKEFVEKMLKENGLNIYNIQILVF